MAQIEITQSYVTYQAQTALMNYASQVALSRSKTKPAIKAAIQTATQIRLGLEALNYSAFLSKDQINQILYLLADIANINALPYAPVVTTVAAPTILVGIQGQTGAQGPAGTTGGGLAFSATNVSIDTVIDTFDVTLASSVQWSYQVADASQTNQRVEQLIATWNATTIVDNGGIAVDPEIGTTVGAISFSTNISAGKVQLIANVTSGTWNITGTRQIIPVTGNGIVQPTSLTNGSIWIGNSSNQPQARTISGDVTITNAGVSAIGAGVIVNSQINANAAISLSKLAALTINRAVVTDSSGFLQTSNTTATQISYLSNVTSDVQAQINAIAAAGTITGAITPFVTLNASPSLVIVSNPSGKLAVSGVTTTELGYLSGTTSSVQTQLSGKVSKTGDTMSGVLSMGTNKITNLAQGTASTDALRVDQLLPGAWNNATLISPWVNQNRAFQYRKDAQGKIHLRGQVWTVSTNLTSFTLTIATLPAGFRPSQTNEFPLNYYDGTSRTTLVIIIDPSGNVSISAGAGAPAQDVNLDSISFWTD